MAARKKCIGNVGVETPMKVIILKIKMLYFVLQQCISAAVSPETILMHLMMAV
jgi:hypothetical protein